MSQQLYQPPARRVQSTSSRLITLGPFAAVQQITVPAGRVHPPTVVPATRVNTMAPVASSSRSAQPPLAPSAMDVNHKMLVEDQGWEYGRSLAQSGTQPDQLPALIQARINTAGPAHLRDAQIFWENARQGYNMYRPIDDGRGTTPAASQSSLDRIRGGRPLSTAPAAPRSASSNGTASAVQRPGSSRGAPGQGMRSSSERPPAVRDGQQPQPAPGRRQQARDLFRRLRQPRRG